MHAGTNDSPADAEAIPATITQRIERLGVEIPLNSPVEVELIVEFA